ncbi:MAG: tricarballylate utilization 4Fe-4S protein TcuB [Campylobacter sp.]|nr:tricarballylate utilization 4Fe-4S protein TcuB [Campylobacter sp.]
MKITQIYEDAIKSCVICNSCRYCEGLCAVFPAMEKKREFNVQDMDYLANLCHNCSECFYDCQYAPPHEFNVSIPAQLAALRKQSYKKYAFPNFLSFIFEKNAFISTLIFVVLFFLGFYLAFTPKVSQNGDFFELMPYTYMTSLFSIVGILVLLALIVGIVKYAKAIELKNVSFSAFIQTLKDALSLKYLGGHKSEGCTYPNEQRSNVRRVFHHFTAYGFIFCFIATTLGAIYHHFLHIYAPYDITQLPKLFGFVGGILLCIGTLGLFALKLSADKRLIDETSVQMDYVFILMLFIVSFTGLLLMFLRESEYLAPLLWLHLSLILTFFILLPYSKFVHIFYRFIALLKYNVEEEEH